MKIQHFFHAPSSTLTYVVHDEDTAVVVDPVRDYDMASGATSWEASQQVARYLDQNRLAVPYVLDTHAHADHMTGLPFFRERYGSRSVTGSQVGKVQAAFRDLFELGEDFPVDGSQFDVLIDEGDVLKAGTIAITAFHTPGHTPAHMSWQVQDVLFLGDSLFMPDQGSARCDFPGGSAAELYDSVQRIYALPDETRLYACHDYQPGGRELVFTCTVADQKRDNVTLKGTTSKEEFVAFRTQRDAGLDVPRLILPSVQVNIRAGELPEPEPGGHRYLKMPLDAFGPTKEGSK